jgi:tRNA dimethylallyltransferase
VLRMVLTPAQRPVLSERLGQRFGQMLASGLVDEVQSLRAQANLAAHTPAMRSVGYRQVWQYLEGEVEYSAMVERAIIATRQLAKRQLTWLRVEPGATWLDSLDPRVAARASDLVERSEAATTATDGRRDDDPVK